MDSFGKYVPTYNPMTYQITLFDQCFTELYANRTNSNFKQQVTNCVVQNHKIAKAVKEHLTKNLEHIPVYNFVYDFSLNEKGIQAYADTYDNSYMAARERENIPDEDEE